MPQKSSIHIDAALTNLAIQYRNLQFVASLVLPFVPVVFESDKYYKFYREELTEVDSHRAVGAEANEVDWDVTSESYKCEEYALRKLVADRIVNNSDAPVRPRLNTMAKLRNLIDLGYEIRAMNLITGGSLTSAVPNPKWDETSPTIEADIDTAKASVRLNAGVEANMIVMNDQVKDVVKKDSTIRNLIRYTIQGSGGQELLVNGDLPPVLFGLKVVLAMACYNSANAGQTASYARIWPDDVLVSFVEPSPSLEALSLGYTFRVQNGLVVKTWREDKRDGEMIQVQTIQDEKLVATPAGYLIDNVLS